MNMIAKSILAGGAAAFSRQQKQPADLKLNGISFERQHGELLQRLAEFIAYSRCSYG
jgi:hypothetical protein